MAAAPAEVALPEHQVPRLTVEQMAHLRRALSRRWRRLEAHAVDAEHGQLDW